MRKCPQCPATNDDERDFCHNCGAYLDWDPVAATNGERTLVGVAGATGAAGADDTADHGEASVVITGSVRGGRHDQVTVELLRPDRKEADGALSLGVPAGGRVLFYARVRNQSDIVDSYVLRIEGLPDGWWTIDPPTAYLLPVDSREGYEEEIAVAVHPPKSWEAEARAWQFTVVVASQKHPPREARETAKVVIEPFWQIDAAVRPASVGGRRRRSLLVGVQNSGNTRVPILLEAFDRGNQCEFEVPLAPCDIPRGAIGEIPVAVRPRKTHWIGRPKDHQLDFVAKGANDPDLKAPAHATLRQYAWIPWWLPLALVLLALAAIVLYLLWPRHVKVPDVRKQPNTFAAQKRLEKAGLTLNPKVKTKLRPHVSAGTVIAQAPAPGKTVDKGKSVSLVVAAGHRLVRVPKLKGMKVTDADQRLKAAKLTLGAVQPKLDPNAKVGKQLPHAGARRRTGTPVSVVLAKPKKKKTKAKKAGAAAVPAVKPGTTPAAAAAALKKLGLKAHSKLVIDPHKRGTLLGTVPAAGQKPKDGKVALIVSAGFPQIAYDNGVDANVRDGFTGKTLHAISRGASVASRGAWTADGKQVAYARHRDDELFLVSPGSKDPGKFVWTHERPVFHPTFAPLLKRKVLVFATREVPDTSAEPAEAAEKPAGKAEVCWMDLTDSPPKGPKCLRVTGRATGINGFAWSPRGTVLLVAVETRDGPGLLRLASRSAFASDPRQWTGRRRLATHIGRAGHGVRAASFSPDGEKVAVVSNLNSSGRFKVSVVKKKKLQRKTKTFKGGTGPLGCDVDWRPDGLELLVVRADPRCAKEKGRIVRLTSKGLAVAGKPPRGLFRHPSYQPIDLSPGPGRAPVRGTQP